MQGFTLFFFFTFVAKVTHFKRFANFVRLNVESKVRSRLIPELFRLVAVLLAVKITLFLNRIVKFFLKIKNKQTLPWLPFSPLARHYLPTSSLKRI